MYFSTVACQLLVLNLGLSYARLVQKTLELTWEYGSPNGGTPREMVFTNGESPGPDLIFDEDDLVEVLVINHLPFNTTVHWHGIEMRETPWADGVPGLSQAPIAPGSSFLYIFRAYPAGTFWYHSHYKGLMQDGQLGSMYIRRKPDAPRPYSVITQDPYELEQLEYAENNPNLIMVTDWTYLTSKEYHNIEIESGFNVFCVDSLLINGQGSVYCPGYAYLEELGGHGITAVLEGTHLTEKGCLQPDLYNVQGDYGHWNISAIPGPVAWNCTPSTGETPIISVNPDENGWASLNFIDGAPQKGITVSVDNHPMWVYEVDGQFVQPREVEMIGIYNGARYTVMIKLDQTPGDYTIRAAVNGGDQVMSTFAILSYANQYENPPDKPPPQASLGPYSKGYMNYGGGNTSADVRQLRFTENLAAFGVPPPPPSSQVSTTLRTGMERVNRSWAWSLGNHALYEPESTAATPLLFETDPLAVIAPKNVLSTQNDTWVDIVLEIIANEHDPIHPPHPIHKHGNRAYIIGNGIGKFTWENVSQAEAERPELFYVDERAALRDTFVMDFFDSRREPGAWIVVRYFVTGKFAGILHCHIASHQLSGMSLALLDGVDVWDTCGQEQYPVYF